jgi:hypothetical protein
MRLFVVPAPRCTPIKKIRPATIDIGDREIGGPVRDRTGDFFHGMEFTELDLADGKSFNSRTSRQKPLKSVRFAAKMLPKRVLPICYQTDSGRGLTAGDQPFLVHSLRTRATEFHSSLMP